MSSSRNSQNAAARGDNTDVQLTTISKTAGTDANRDRHADDAFVENGNSEKDAANQLIPPFNPAGSPDLNQSFDIPEGFNLYRNKKTLTQGLMDIALFSANANQLRYILEHGATSQAYFYIAVSLIIISLVLQIAVGLLLLMSVQYNISVECQREIAYKYGNYVVIGIFLITVVNIFIAAFGGPAVYLPTSSSPAAAGANNQT